MNSDKPNYDKLNLKQQTMVELACGLQSGGELFFSGAAGTGKTFATKCMVDRLRADKHSVVVLAPTNKAAQRLQQMGQPAQTIHSYIYAYIGDDPKTKQPMFKHRLDVDTDTVIDYYDYVIVDECSMVGDKMYADLKRIQAQDKNCFIFIGDPFQLPPVKQDDIFKAENADVYLDEVQRQAADNPVIQFATFLRESKEYQPYPRMRKDFRMVEHVKALLKDRFRPQIICWTNARRRNIIKSFRSDREFQTLLPQPGEPMISVVNDYEHGIYNGTMFTVLKSSEQGNHILLDIEVDDGRIITEYVVSPVEMWKDYSREKDIPKYFYGPQAPKSRVTWAYGITAHKAQGSEWPTVAVVDETRYMKDEYIDRRRWLYTAITRTRETLIIINGK